MISPPLPPSPRGPQCPPAAVLEALSAGEPSAEATRLHVEGCAHCGGQLSALTSERDAFVRARPPELFLRQLERRARATPRPGLRRLLLVLGEVAALLALVVLVPWLLMDHGARPRGDAFRVAASHEGGPLDPLGYGALVRTGDALRFAYETSEPGHLLVLALDGAGTARAFYPDGGTTSAPLAAGQRDFLPGSVVLGAVQGPVLLFAVFSPRPIEAAPLLQALRMQAGRAEPTVSCPDCRVSMLRLHKSR